MRIILLGTAAGGGVPQWNCSCVLCAEARASSGRVATRKQSGVAISADDRRWFLLNASPDLRFQIESFPPLQPQGDATRNTPIEGVLLTNADLDHTLGLMLLREGPKLDVHCSPQIRRALTTGFPIAEVLESFCGINWINVPDHPEPLLCRDGSPSGLLHNAFPVPGKPPRYMEGRIAPSPGDSIGYRCQDKKTGGSLVFVPDLAGIQPELLPIFGDCDVLLFDGTFWSEHEMHDRGATEISARQMGHVPISGDNGSLKVLATLPVKNKVYVHINNTNPILLEDSPERAAVLAAGAQVGRDGMEFVI